MEIVRAENVSITYDGVKDAVSNVSFTVEEGQIVGIVGESGSGKSTILHGLQGLLPRTSARTGTISLFGQDIDTMTAAEMKRVRGRDVAMIFQDTGRYLNPISRVGKQYTSFLKIHEKKPVSELYQLEKEMLNRVHLKDVDRILHAYPFELSGGMRQRVGIAMAMSLRPRLLLADEPTSALDVTVQAQVIYEMMELRKKYGTTIIFVTHSMGVAAYMSDVIGVMQNGKLVEWGETEKLISSPRQAYTRSLLDAVIELRDERLITTV